MPKKKKWWLLRQSKGWRWSTGTPHILVNYRGSKYLSVAPPILTVFINGSSTSQVACPGSWNPSSRSPSTLTKEKDDIRSLLSIVLHGFSLGHVTITIHVSQGKHQRLPQENHIALFLLLFFSSSTYQPINASLYAIIHLFIQFILLHTTTTNFFFFALALIFTCTSNEWWIINPLFVIIHFPRRQHPTNLSTESSIPNALFSRPPQEMPINKCTEC